MIIIPMAGLSSRFFKAGFTEPKYKLLAYEQTLFEWSLKTFEKYFHDEKFLFICRDVYDTPIFIEQQLKKIGIKNYQISVLQNDTRGQAETVYLNLDKVPENERILIFNIDTYRKNFEFFEDECDAYLEVFEGEGEHWSFVEPIVNTNLVLRTTEKVRISNLCSNGIYFFRNKKIYKYAYEHQDSLNSGEIYIAPLFNNIIKDKCVVKYKIVDKKEHIFMGTPIEYAAFLKSK